MEPRVPNLRAFCRRILESGDLATKLAPPPNGLSDDDPGEPLCLDRPARDADLTLSGGAERLPRPDRLESRDARARCLARFAHHELMAVELFAWALLRWPTLEPALRRGWLGILVDEQRHCRLYLERLAAHGSRLADHARSDYFWKHAPAIATSPHGVRAFLCAMGLTLEQANLDFTLLYRDGFRAAGDEASARACQIVHADEIRHVRSAVRALERLSPPGQSDVEAYAEAVPFPFSAARAKGRHFEVGPRERAGLSAAFIDAVRAASSTGGGRRG